MLRPAATKRAAADDEFGDRCRAESSAMTEPAPDTAKPSAAGAWRLGTRAGRAVLLGMLLARVGHVIGSLAHLSMRHMGVMPGRLMVASFMLGRGFLVVVSSGVAAACCSLMMLCGLRVGRHIVSLRIRH
jgi:hypothetical protein